jgi:hypothetical protein
MHQTVFDVIRKIMTLRASYFAAHFSREYSTTFQAKKIISKSLYFSITDNLTRSRFWESKRGYKTLVSNLELILHSKMNFQISTPTLFSLKIVLLSVQKFPNQPQSHIFQLESDHNCKNLKKIIIHTYLSFSSLFKSFM